MITKFLPGRGGENALCKKGRTKGKTNPDDKGLRKENALVYGGMQKGTAAKCHNGFLQGKSRPNAAGPISQKKTPHKNTP